MSRRHSSGATLIEASLTVAVVLFVTFVTIDLGLVIYNISAVNEAVSNAAAETTRYPDNPNCQIFWDACGNGQVSHFVTQCHYLLQTSAHCCNSPPQMCACYLLMAKQSVSQQLASRTIGQVEVNLQKSHWATLYMDADTHEQRFLDFSEDPVPVSTLKSLLSNLKLVANFYPTCILCNFLPINFRRTFVQTASLGGYQCDTDISPP